MEKRTILLPYGTTFLPLHIENDTLKAVLCARNETLKEGKSQEDLVRKSLEEPIGTDRLCKLARGKKKITLPCRLQLLQENVEWSQSYIWLH